jgi:hypothetical protein
LLLQSLVNNSIEHKISALEAKFSNIEYKNYILKSLSYQLFKEKYYAQSLKYIEEYLQNTADDSITPLLIKTHSELSNWDEAILLLEKYISNKVQTEFSQKDLANYLIMAGKHALSTGQDMQAYRYLTSSLLHDPTSEEALEMLCKINMANNNHSANIEILEIAFAKIPSYHLFLLYLQSSQNHAQEIYTTLESLADPKNHRDVFFSIAAHLGLSEKIRELQNISS